MTVNKYEVSFWSNENFLKLDSGYGDTALLKITELCI